jgi:hypothetical protein
MEALFSASEKQLPPFSNVPYKKNYKIYYILKAQYGVLK